jgi:hypothetical protein
MVLVEEDDGTFTPNDTDVLVARDKNYVRNYGH